MIIKAKRFSVTHGMLPMNCFNLPHPLTLKKISPVTATSYVRKTRSLVLVNSEHNDSTANTDSAVHISYLTPKISVLVHV
jgi:hypothetical protein